MKTLEQQNKLFNSIKDVLEKARSTAYRAINVAMVQTYWEIGRLIVEDEQRGEQHAEYGKAVLKELSIRLTKEYGKGFDESNLRYMRLFFNAFPIRDTLRHELTWSHYRLLIRVKNEKAREYYLKESIETNWSTRTLERQIHSFYYERLLSSKPHEINIEQMKQETNLSQPHPTDFIKDPYILEFLNLPSNLAHKEKDVENALINHLQKFLLELGSGFSFVARQQHIRTGTSEFFIDLIFYHFKLRCFVLIDLKLDKLSHQDIGQMDMYVRMYDDLYKNKDDNPAIGIILCSEKEETIVKYSVLAENSRLFASEYKLYLPSEEQLKQLIEHDRHIIEQQLSEKDT